MAEGNSAPGLVMVCGKCGSDEVTRDAWAEWNVGAQAWALGALFEQAFCHRCQASTRIEGARIEGRAAGP